MDDEQNERETTKDAGVGAARPRVLVVDDQPVIGNMLRRTLQSQCAVDVAENGREALAFIRSGAIYDLVLCDLMMPELSGLELLDIMEREAPQLLSRCVLMTGRSCRSDELLRLMQLDVNVLHKPFGSLDLSTVVMGYVRPQTPRQ